MKNNIAINNITVVKNKKWIAINSISIIINDERNYTYLDKWLAHLSNNNRLQQPLL